MGGKEGEERRVRAPNLTLNFVRPDRHVHLYTFLLRVILIIITFHNFHLNASL